MAQALGFLFALIALIWLTWSVIAIVHKVNVMEDHLEEEALDKGLTISRAIPALTELLQPQAPTRVQPPPHAFSPPARLVAENIGAAETAAAVAVVLPTPKPVELRRLSSSASMPRIPPMPEGQWALETSAFFLRRLDDISGSTKEDLPFESERVSSGWVGARDEGGAS